MTSVIAILSVGSLNDNFLPGGIVMIDQYIDNTVNKNISFYDKYLVKEIDLYEQRLEKKGIFKRHFIKIGSSKKKMIIKKIFFILFTYSDHHHDL